MNSVRFSLVEHLGGSSEGWGHDLGRRVQQALQDQLVSLPRPARIYVSLAGLKRADISFCRAAVIEIARRERQTCGFSLVQVSDADLLENWHAAAWMAGQPIFAFGETWQPGSPYRLLGPQPSTGLRAMFEYVLSRPVARTSEAALALNLKISNASNKLSQLWQDGYVLRLDQSAVSGGIEYEYVRLA